MSQKILQAFDTGCRQGAYRTRGDGIDAGSFRAEAGSHIAHIGFQAGLGHTHNIVIGHGADRPNITQGQHGAMPTLHHGPGSIRQRRETVGTDFMRHQKTRACDILQIITLELLFGGMGHGMHQYVQVVPVIIQMFEDGLDLSVVGDVTGDCDFRIGFTREGFHAFAQSFILVSECQSRSFTAHGLGDTPGDRTIAGHPDDQGVLVF